MKHVSKILLSIFICLAIIIVLPSAAKGQESISDNTFALSTNKYSRKDAGTDLSSKPTYLTASPFVSVSTPVSVSPDQQGVVIRISFTALDFLSNEAIAKQHLYEISVSSYGSGKISMDRNVKKRWFKVCVINNSVTTIAGKIYRHLFQ